MKARIISLLRWSEQYTGTDMVYLVSGGIWTVVGEIATILSTLGIAMVVSRYFPKAAYGEYKYILSVVALLGVFSLNGLGSAVFQSVAHGFDGALEDGFWKNMRWSILVMAGALAVASYYFVFGNYDLALGVLIGGCASPLFSSANLAQFFLSAKKDFKRVTIYFGIIATVIPALSLMATAFLTSNALWLVAVYFASNALSTYWAYLRTVDLYRPDSTQHDPHMLSYGKHLSAMGILVTIADNIDQILLFHFVGAAELAIYNFATAIPDQIKGPLKTLDSMIQARFAQRKEHQIEASMNNKFLLLLIATGLSIIAYWIAAPFIYRVFFPSYVDAVFYSQLYVLSILGFVLTPANSYLKIKKRVREQYIFNVSTSIFQIFAMLIGAVYLGLIGVIYARILSRLFLGLASLYLYNRSVRGLMN